MTLIKICGLRDIETLDAAIAGGADFVGLVHFARSPRHIDLPQARTLAQRARGRTTRVVLLVDPDDALVSEVAATVAPDLIQLHGRENPERVAAIRALAHLPVMKAVGVAVRADLAQVRDHAAVADHILLDAKPPPGAALPGGNGRAFDWDLLDGALDPGLSFVLSGGLDPSTVAGAIARTGASAVDVSSGVERGPGRKDPALIAAFIAAVRQIDRRQIDRSRVADPAKDSTA